MVLRHPLTLVTKETKPITLNCKQHMLAVAGPPRSVR